MQTGLENVPIFVHPGMPVMYQPQGINIIMTPSFNVTNNVPTQVIFSEKNDGDGVAEIEPEDDEADQDNFHSDLTDEQIQAYKQKIYQHPLFQLFSNLFEACDQYFQSSSENQSANVDAEIQNFLLRCHQEGTSISSDDPDVDELMIEAIKVMKIHMLELEKVHELCKDFCTRYINCLKTTLHSSQLVPPDLEEDLEVSGDISNSSMKPTGNVIMPAVAPISGLGQGQVVSGGTVYQMVQTPHGLVAQPIQIQSPVSASTSPLSGRTVQESVSYVGLNGSVVESSHLLDHLYNQTEDEITQKKAKRGVLPKKATRVMKAWLFQHISHPYPTEDEKRQIASQTNLTILQVNNWFINGRRRILQPMLNSGAAEISKSKVRRQAKKTVQRFWPENIAVSKQNSSADVEDEEDDDESDDETDTDVENLEQNDNLSSIPGEQTATNCDISAPQNASLSDGAKAFDETTQQKNVLT